MPARHERADRSARSFQSQVVANSCRNLNVYLSCVEVETLCANSLAEVGVAVGDFVEALEASKLSQDISTAVYQQLAALDDFVTFKKLMVRYRAQNGVA